MRDRVGLNDRQLRFVRLVAAGEHSVTECHAQSYGGRRDSANAHKLAKRLAAEVAAERERLGIAAPGAEEPVIADADKAALIVEQRRLYELALERGETGLAQKCLRSIERLQRRPGVAGRPVAEKPVTQPKGVERDSARVEALVAAILTEADVAELEATWGNDAPPWGRVSQTSAEAQ